MWPSRNSNYNDPSFLGSDIPINGGLGQQQSQQLNALYSHRNQQPLQQLHAFLYSHPRPQSQYLQQQQRPSSLEEMAAARNRVWTQVVASRANQQRLMNFPVNRSHELIDSYLQRLRRFVHDQRHRPQDNNIQYWRMFVAEYFAPNAKMKLCVSVYGNHPQTAGLIPQDAWHCELCNHNPGSGFEASVEVFPRLFQHKFLRVREEYYLDMLPEFTNRNGQIVLLFPKAAQETVIGESRVIRKGQLRIVFNLDMKICSWEFCTHSHEEFIPRRLSTPQLIRPLSSSGELAQSMEVFQVNDLGYPSRYFRILEIAHVLNGIMMDQIQQTQDQAHQQQQQIINHPYVVSANTNNVPMQQFEVEDDLWQSETRENLEMNGISSDNDLTPSVGDNFGESPRL